MKELEHNEKGDAISVLDTVLCSHPLRRVLLPMVPALQAQIEAEKSPERLENLKDNLEYVQKQIGTF
jgi:hypothetical protein